MVHLFIWHKALPMVDIAQSLLPKCSQHTPVARRDDRVWDEDMHSECIVYVAWKSYIIPLLYADSLWFMTFHYDTTHILGFHMITKLIYKSMIIFQPVTAYGNTSQPASSLNTIPLNYHARLPHELRLWYWHVYFISVFDLLLGTRQSALCIISFTCK